MKKYFLLFAAAVCFFQKTNAQAIPNPGFETWYNAFGVDDVEGWVTLNILSTPLYGPNPVEVTQETGANAFTGSSSMRITTITLQNNPFPGIVPHIAGFVFTGAIIPPSSLVNGFWYAGRPDTLSLSNGPMMRDSL